MFGLNLIQWMVLAAFVAWGWGEWIGYSAESWRYPVRWGRFVWATAGMLVLVAVGKPIIMWIYGFSLVLTKFCIGMTFVLVAMVGFLALLEKIRGWIRELLSDAAQIYVDATGLD